MNPPKEFLASLKPDDLVAATVQSSDKLHLVRIVRPVTRGMVRGNPSDKALSQLFDARVLCELRPRFWWRPTDQMEAWQAENKCRWCWSKWRAVGRPAIKGWAKAEAALESNVRLPWGWHEVTPSSHPLDLDADAPDPDPDEDERKVGSKRVEVKRWLRGMRYVRLTQDLKDKRFCVRYGDVNDEQQEEGWTFKGGWDAALLRAVTVMALGGTPNSSTKYDRLTMRDVARRA
jgi:hypothetical protein